MVQVRQSVTKRTFVHFRLAGLNELQSHTRFLAPGGQRPTAKLRSVVENNCFRHAVQNAYVESFNGPTAR